MNDKLTNDEHTGNVFLDCALEIAQGIDSLERKSEVISLISLKYVEAGELDVAVGLAEGINDSYQRDQALAGIAAKCVKAGAADEAETLCDGIDDEGVYALATEQVAVAFAESGAFEKSIEVAHKLAESAPTLSRIALSCIASGRPVQALEAARLMDYPDLKATVLVELAAKALQAGQNNDALDLLLEAAQVSEDIEFPEQRISTLVAMASLNNRCGQEEPALKILTRAHDECKSENFLADASLAQIAAGFAELRRYDQADQVIEEIENPFQFAHATALVALEYHKAGDTARTLELLADAMEIGRDEEVYGDQSLLMRESLLSELAGCYASVGHYEEALQTIEVMSSPGEQNHTLREIAKQCVRSGHNSRVFQVTEMIKDNYARVLGELEIVDAFVDSDQLALADHSLSQALARITAIERPYEKAMALTEIAPRFARREQAAQASQVLFDALTTVAVIEDGYHQSRALINLSGKYQKLGQQAGDREQAVLEEISFRVER